jgi:serine/threonine protein kinase
MPKYQILMELGRGGMGVVHLAMSRGPQGFIKLVVLKMMRRQLVGDEESHRMFLEEARISARLAHPNIVQVYEVIAFDDTPTIVMEYLEGQPLYAILSAGPLPLPIHLHILIRVLDGLHAAHELRDYDETPLRLIHRDVSPHNVFVLFDGQVKVLDFGIAKAVGSEVETRTGELKGKIKYMPPEQFLRDRQDHRVDIFAVGVMLWEALSGQRMWGEMSEAEIVRHLLDRNIADLPAEANVHPELAAICRRALAPDPADRYDSAQELQRDLEAHLARQPDRCTSEEVGRYLREHFSEQREATKKLIDAHIKAAERMAPVVLPPTSSEAETRMLRPSAHAATASSTLRTRRPRLLFGAVAAVLVLAIAAGIAVFGHDDRQGKPAARAAAAAGVEADPAVACGHGFKLCTGQCVSVDRPDFGCGGDTCQSCRIVNATARCNQRHECDVAVCYQDFDDCDGDNSNGCETNVRIDPDHCGGCSHKCPELAHAVRGCGDVCTIWRCETGFRDCDGVVADGCEVNTMGDPRNCGHCGFGCKAGQRCRHGECEP